MAWRQLTIGMAVAILLGGVVGSKVSEREARVPSVAAAGEAGAVSAGALSSTPGQLGDVVMRDDRLQREMRAARLQELWLRELDAIEERFGFNEFEGLSEACGQALAGWANRACETDLPAARDMIALLRLNCGDEEDRILDCNFADEAKEAIFVAWAELDPSGPLEWVLSQGADSEHLGYVDSLVERWAEVDPSGAVRRTVALKSAWGLSALQTAVGVWHRTDPEAAIIWLQDNRPSTELQKFLKCQHVDELTVGGRESLAALLSELPDGQWLWYLHASDKALTPEVIAELGKRPGAVVGMRRVIPMLIVEERWAEIDSLLAANASLMGDICRSDQLEWQADSKLAEIESWLWRHRELLVNEESSFGHFLSQLKTEDRLRLAMRFEGVPNIRKWLVYELASEEHEALLEILDELPSELWRAARDGFLSQTDLEYEEVLGLLGARPDGNPTDGEIEKILEHAHNADLSVAEMLPWFAKLTDRGQRRVQLKRILEKHTIDKATLGALLACEPDPGVRQRWREQILYRAGLFEAGSVTELTETLADADGSARQEVLRRMAVLATSDGDAESWLESLAEDDRAAAIPEVMSRADESELVHLLLRYPEVQERSDFNQMLIGEYGHGFGGRQLDEVILYLGKLDDRKAALQLAERIVEVDTDPELALAALAAFGGDDGLPSAWLQQAEIYSIGDQAERDVVAAARLLSSKTAEPTEAHYEALFSTWADVDLPAAQEWVASLELPDQRELASAVLALEAARSDPEFALEVLDRNSGELRARILRQLGSAWSDLPDGPLSLAVRDLAPEDLIEVAIGANNETHYSDEPVWEEALSEFNEQGKRIVDAVQSYLDPFGERNEDALAELTPEVAEMIRERLGNGQEHWFGSADDGVASGDFGRLYESDRPYYGDDPFAAADDSVRYLIGDGPMPPPDDPFAAVDIRDDPFAAGGGEDPFAAPAGVHEDPFAAPGGG